MKRKKLISLLLAGTMALGSLAFTGCGSSSDSGDANTFSWWIIAADGDGIYYDKYEDHPGVQWLRNQYWDVGNHTLGSEEMENRSILLSKRPSRDRRQTILTP